jgi:NADH:ubiquinone oxidoreductase subunit F (NADH-binding)
MPSDFAQIHSRVEKECRSVTDISRIGIRIAAAPGNSPGDSLFNLVQKKICSDRIPGYAIRTGSFGCPDFEPIVAVDTPESALFLCLNADPGSIPDTIAKRTFLDAAGREGNWYHVRGENPGKVPSLSSLPFFDLQNRVALRNCGWIDPEIVGHYILAGNGYAGLAGALRKTPRECLAAWADSSPGARIHSGSSSPDEWSACLEIRSRGKCLICNAVEADSGEPGAGLLLESDPHSILEGLLIGAYATGASRSIIYVRRGRAAAKLRRILEKMREYGLLGAGILGSSFEAQVEVLEVPELYRAGPLEEALQCLGPGRCASRVSPALPAMEELAGLPVIIANPELLACIPVVFQPDGDQRTGLGLNKDAASRILTLTGSVARRGTVEVPCGVSLRNVVEGIGGGVAGVKPLRALKVGGSSGRLVEPEELDGCAHCRLDASIGAVEVLNADADIVGMCRDRMGTVNIDSCGKCLFCSEGSRQMFRMLEKIAAGDGKPQILDALEGLGEEMKTGSLCNFGSAAPDLVLSGMRLFREEFGRKVRFFSPNP